MGVSRVVTYDCFVTIPLFLWYRRKELVSEVKVHVKMSSPVKCAFTSASRTAMALSQDLRKLLMLNDQRTELEGLIQELEMYSLQAEAKAINRLPDDRLLYMRTLRNEIRKRNHGNM